MTRQNRELYSMLCGNLNGKEVQEGEDIHIQTADSLHCTAEASTTV